MWETLILYSPTNRSWISQIVNLRSCSRTVSIACLVSSQCILYIRQVYLAVKHIVLFQFLSRNYTYHYVPRVNSEHEKCEWVLTCVLRIWQYILALSEKVIFWAREKGDENSVLFFFFFFFCEVGPSWDLRTQAHWPIALYLSFKFVGAI